MKKNGKFFTILLTAAITLTAVSICAGAEYDMTEVPEKPAPAEAEQDITEDPSESIPSDAEQDITGDPSESVSSDTEQDITEDPFESVPSDTEQDTNDDTPETAGTEQTENEASQSEDDEPAEEEAADNTADSGTCGESLTWTLDGEGTLTISGTGKMDDHNSSSSPWLSDERIIKVVIENGVTSIGDYAFYGCTRLTSIDIPESVTYIGRSALEYCRSLTAIDIPDRVTEIGKRAFCRCSSLSSLTFPESVTVIGDDAFNYCSSLTSITFSGGVVSIGDDPFYRCLSLRTANVSENNSCFCSIDGVLFSKDKTDLISYPPGKTDKIYNVPEGVRTVGYKSLKDCSALTSITIPGSVTAIGDYAIANCTSLVNTVIPESVKAIGSYAFYGCPALSDIYYTGTQEQWNAIDKNDPQTPEGCTIHFNYKPCVVLSAAGGDSSVTLDWEEVPGAVLYGVYRYNSSTGKYTRLDLNVTDTTYTVTGLAANTEYSFFVQAYTTKWLPGGDESLITVKTKALYPVVTATPSYNSVTLGWEEVPGAVLYGVYRYNSSTGKYTRLDLNVTDTTYTVTGLAANTEYSFFVQAYTTKWLPGGDESTVTVTTK